jgi:glucose-6-phosphate 1-dehydrogenase
VPATFVILGAGSDVTSRYVVPGLVQLDQAGRLPGDLRIVATGRHDHTDEEYRTELRQVACDEGCDAPAVDALLDRVVWAEADATDQDQIDSLPVADQGDVVVYLALPPSVFAAAIGAVADAPWSDRVRLAIEKPFGTDLASAIELNATIAERFESTRVHRVDHFLGVAAVRRLPGLLDDTARRVDVVWDETLALEGRAGYYDDTGALVDMLQNHLLQVLAVVLCGGAPSSTSMPEARLAVLRGLRPLPETSVRARYSAGRIDGEPIPAYVDEDGVDPRRQTETFARLDLRSDDPRWESVAMRLRSGKALDRDRSMVRAEMAAGRVVVADLGEDPDEGLGPYAMMLGDLLDGDQTWFVSAAEAEEQWRIMEPVIDAWQAGAVPLLEYPAGSNDPAGSDEVGATT